MATNLPQGIDPDVLNFVKAVRDVETPGGKAVAGASGELPSRFQYMPGTWKTVAGKYLGDSNAPLTPTNEFKATYLRFADLKKQGYSFDKIASIHNSGRPDYAGKVGVNKQGVHYDVPGYVNKVGQAYTKRRQETATTAPPTSALSPTPIAPSQPQQGLLQSVGGALEGGAIGALKGLGSTLAGASSLGEKILQAPLKAAGIQVQTPLGQQIKESGKLTPQGTAQKVGFGAEQLGEFLVPGGSVGEAAKGLEAVTGLEKATGIAGKLGRLGTRATLEAGTFGGQTALQQGGITPEVKRAAIFGAATPVAAKGFELAGRALGGTAEHVINTLIKPLQKDFAYGKNPGRGVAREGIVANTFDELVNKITAKRAELGQKIGQTLKENADKQVSLTGVFSPIDEAIAKASEAPKTNAPLITRLKNLKSDLLGLKVGEKGQKFTTRKFVSVTPEEAFNFKQKVADLTQFTGSPTDDKAANSALKKVYGMVKERINGVVPEVRSLNERFANIKSAEVAAKYREKILERQNILPLAAKTSGVVAGAVLGGAPGAALGAVLAAGAEKIAGSALLKTRLARLLAQMSPEEVSAAMLKYPVLKQVLQRLK